MCLYLTPNSKVLTARRDLVVYKWLGYHNGKLKSPVYFGVWKVNELHTVEQFTSGSNSWITHYFIDELPKNVKVISKGIHCYTKNQAKREAKNGTSVYPALIPKGTKYIRGKYGEMVTLGLKITSRRKIRTGDF